MYSEIAKDWSSKSEGIDYTLSCRVNLRLFLPQQQCKCLKCSYCHYWSFPDSQPSQHHLFYNSPVHMPDTSHNSVYKM